MLSSWVIQGLRRLDINPLWGNLDYQVGIVQNFGSLYLFWIIQNIRLGNSGFLNFVFLGSLPKTSTTQYFGFGLPISEKHHLDDGANYQWWRY
jgi:hypothetical protein